MAPNPLLIDPQIVLSFPDAFIFAKGLGFHAVPPLSGVCPTAFGPPADYTVSRFLPFARLLLRTARPPLVAIRTRKPWVRFIFVLLKFVNVFFIVCDPGKMN